MVGEARSRLAPEGMVLVHGELWQAVAEDPPIRKGESVVVTGIHGLKIKVRRANKASATGQGRGEQA